MERRSLAGIGAGLAALAVAVWFGEERAVGAARLEVPEVDSAKFERAAVVGDDRAVESAPIAASAVRIDEVDAASGARRAPGEIRGPEDLDALVAWLHSLSDEELLRLSNAEFEFRDSALVELLQDLEGEWVVPALGGLAVRETDPLVKAILVEGLCGGASIERYDDEQFLPVLSELLVELSVAELDPYEVGRDAIFSAWSACLRQGADYAALVEAVLADADNPLLLVTGYSAMGGSPEAVELLGQTLRGHASADGRLGALLGLGRSVADGWLEPAAAVELGRLALETETDERNRVNLLAMMAAECGEAGRRALEELVRALDPESMGSAAMLLATTADPDETRALLERSLAHEALDPAAREALYRALGALPGGAGVGRLVDVATDPRRSTEERLAGLRALASAERTEELERDLAAIVRDEADSELRVEALRLLHDGAGTGAVDLRSLAVADDDPAVRSEAVVLASMEPDPETRAWLEERLLADDSLDVKASALGALVMHAHYAGGGDAAREYLARASAITDDPGALALIRRGQELVDGHDPRLLRLGVEEDARFYAKLAGLTEGAGSRALRRHSQRLNRMAVALRTAAR